MAQKTMTAVRGLVNSNLVIVGSFIPNGAGAIATKYGRGFTVARTSAGLWTVTLQVPFTNFVSIVAGGQWASANADAHQYTIGDISIANKTFAIKHLASADVSTTNWVATDISTSGTANKVNFVCHVAMSKVPGAGI